MAPKISLALGFQEHHDQPHENPSILMREVDDLDDDDWDEHVKSRRRSPSVEATFNLCFVSLSSSLNAMTTRAKKLYSRESPRWGGQPRSFMIEVPSARAEHSLARVNSMPAPYRSSESDLDLFGGTENKGLEEVCLSKVETPTRASTPGLSRFAILLPTRSRTQGSKKIDK